MIVSLRAVHGWPSQVHGWPSQWKAAIPGGERGFTLVELLVAIGIFGIIAAVAVPHLDPRRMQINAAQRLVIANLRLARASAITKSLHFKVEFPSSNQIKVERLTQDALGAWIVDSTAVQTLTLPSATHFASAVVGTSVEFNSRGMVVNLATSQQIDIADSFGRTKSLQTWPSGQVNEL